MSHELPCCPGCNARLLIDSGVNLMGSWPEIRARFELVRVAVGGGWERLGLEGMVSLDSPEAAECDTVFFGDLVTRDKACPRCGVPVYDAIARWIELRRPDRSQ